MLIRPYDPADESAVVALWRDCSLTRPWNDPHKDIERKLAVQPEMFLVGTTDGAGLVATVMAGYDGHRGWMNYLAVAESHRGQGLARMMISRVETLLIERGCPKLNLQVRSSNVDAVAFYRRIGLVPDDVICFGKRLIADDAGP